MSDLISPAASAFGLQMPAVSATSPGWGNVWDDTRAPSGSPAALKLPNVLRGPTNNVAWVWDDIETKWVTKADYKDYGPNATETATPSSVWTSALATNALGTGTNPFQFLTVRFVADNPTHQAIYGVSRAYFKSNDGNYYQSTETMARRGNGREGLLSDYENLQAGRVTQTYGDYSIDPKRAQQDYDTKVLALRSRWAALDYIESLGIAPVSAQTVSFSMLTVPPDTDFLLDHYTASDGKNYYFSGKAYDGNPTLHLNEKVVRFHPDGTKDEMTYAQILGVTAPTEQPTQQPVEKPADPVSSSPPASTTPSTTPTADTPSSGQTSTTTPTQTTPTQTATTQTAPMTTTTTTSSGMDLDLVKLSAELIKIFPMRREVMQAVLMICEFIVNERSENPKDLFA